ncbi:MAG: hypothetical protein HPM95_16210 [Alphaproteobacteria bacterium]|nr:hypothetical protein [Alphaproteobacteria bacterium]
MKRIRKAALEEDVERIIRHSAPSSQLMNETADNHLCGRDLAHLNARINCCVKRAISWPRRYGPAWIQFDQDLSEEVAERDVVNAEIELRLLADSVEIPLRQLNRDTAGLVAASLRSRGRIQVARDRTYIGSLRMLADRRCDGRLSRSADDARGQTV